jgi:hypothetical protein
MKRVDYPVFLLFLESHKEMPFVRYYHVNKDGKAGYQLVKSFYKPISFL